MQRLERSLLDDVYKKLEIINKNEYDLLNRIKDDRNLCAHPAFHDNNELFQPSSELARSHIVHAINLLLSNKPIRGKSVIKLFERDLLSGCLLIDLSGMRTLIEKRYVSRAKNSAIKSLIKALLIAPFGSEKGDYKDKLWEISKALRCFGEMQPGIYDECLSDFAVNKVEKILPEDLWKLIVLDSFNNQIYGKMSVEDRIMLKTQIDSLGIEQITENSIFKFLDSSSLKDDLDEKVRIFIDGYMNNNGLGKLIDFFKKNKNEMLIDYILELYGKSGSYYTAEEIGNELIVPFSSCFSLDRERRLFEVVQANNQIRGAGRTSNVLKNIYDARARSNDFDRENWVVFIKTMHDKNVFFQDFQDFCDCAN